MQPLLLVSFVVYTRSFRVVINGYITTFIMIHTYVTTQLLSDLATKLCAQIGNMIKSSSVLMFSYSLFILF